MKNKKGAKRYEDELRLGGDELLEGDEAVVDELPADEVGKLALLDLGLELHRTFGLRKFVRFRQLIGKVALDGLEDGIDGLENGFGRRLGENSDELSGDDAKLQLVGYFLRWRSKPL